jgi:hypothetical protein
VNRQHRCIHSPTTMPAVCGLCDRGDQEWLFFAVSKLASYMTSAAFHHGLAQLWCNLRVSAIPLGIVTVVPVLVHHKSGLHMTAFEKNRKSSNPSDCVQCTTAEWRGKDKEGLRQHVLHHVLETNHVLRLQLPSML